MIDAQYITAVMQIMQQQPAEDRTGVGTRSTFGMCYNSLTCVEDDFPLLLAKRVWWKGVVEELLWMLRGETNIKSLVEKDVHIWDEWATPEGELGPVYGKQWRQWETAAGAVDQLEWVRRELIENPTTRRAVVSAWNPEFLPDSRHTPAENAAMGKQALPPCHTLFQFKVVDGRLDIILYQRSADMFLGVPFNIASYSLLLLIMAKMTGYRAGIFHHFIGDAHIYNNHMESAAKMIEQHRELVKGRFIVFPKVFLNPTLDWPSMRFQDITYEDITLIDYQPMPTIKAEVAV